jgi:CRP-like cAMP-binding protein
VNITNQFINCASKKSNSFTWIPFPSSALSKYFSIPYCPVIANNLNYCLGWQVLIVRGRVFLSAQIFSLLPMNELFQFLDAMHPLTPEIQAALVTRLRKETFRKNRPLLSVGQPCDWFAFIEKGLVKLCYDLNHDHERIMSFHRAGEMTSAIRSYNQGIPSRVSIIALDETIIWKLNRLESDAIAQRYPEFHTHIRRITELQTAIIEDHYLLLAEPHRHRLEILEQQHSWILKDRRIKKYMIADYIGIDKANFSKWRKG